ncbi:MAG: reverse transcriptase N-terminal domain-containing protein [Holosporaceae bacterium]|nr:reverse transcriptase N-terminal domain-containing protein [Holosporaceae bacterium]
MLHRRASKLQKRIHQTSKSSDWKHVKRLQKLLLKPKNA